MNNTHIYTHIYTHIIHTYMPTHTHTEGFNNFKTNQQKCRGNVFWYVKIPIFWKCIQYTIHWDKTQILEKFPLDKINGTENALLFLLQATTNRSFTFTLQFLYARKHKVRLSKTVRFSIFDFTSFLWNFIILFNKMQGLFDFKTS